MVLGKKRTLSQIGFLCLSNPSIIGGTDYCTFLIIAQRTFPDAPSSIYKSTRRHTDAAVTPASPFVDTHRTVVVFGLLGDLCLDEGECSVRHAVCVERRRACPDGFEAQGEGTECRQSEFNSVV